MFNIHWTIIFVFATCSLVSAGIKFNISEAKAACLRKFGGIELVKLPNGGIYHVEMTEMSWFRARDWCREHGMGLATAETKEDNAYITTLLLKYIQRAQLPKDTYTTFWFGLSDQEEESKFVWWSNGKPLGSFSFWGPEQPDNDMTVGNCVQYLYRDGPLPLWNDAVCIWPSRFICEVYGACKYYLSKK